MGVETELKYSPTGAFNRETLFSDSAIAPFCGEIKKISMHTEYLDTKDRAAAKRGITLRRRWENGESVVYAKCGISRGGDFSKRGEWCVASADLDAAARLLAEAGAPTEELSGLSLITVGEVEFERYECEVVLSPEFSFVLSYDEGFFCKTKPFCEIELELKLGSEEELLLFGERLSKKLGLCPEGKSKYIRSLY